MNPVYRRGILLCLLWFRFTACATLTVAVPVFGFGIGPRGPSTSRASRRRASCGGRDHGVEVDPAALDFCRISSPPTDLASGFLRLALLVAARDHQDFLGLAQPVRAAPPCRGPSGRRASDRHPAACASSTVSSNLAYFTFWEVRLPRSRCAAARHARLVPQISHPAWHTYLRGSNWPASLTSQLFSIRVIGVIG